MIRLQCICGHLKKSHFPQKDFWFAGQDWCEDCSKKLPYERGVMFHNYTPDNLKYIEQLAVKKGLV